MNRTNTGNAVAAPMTSAAVLGATQAMAAEEITVAYFLEWPMPFQYAKVMGTYEQEMGVKTNWVSFDTGTAMCWDANDDFKRADGARIVEVNGQRTDFDPLDRLEEGFVRLPRPTFEIDSGSVTLTDRGAMPIAPYQGWQMEPIWLPAPEAAFSRLISIGADGYQSFTLFEHLGWSLLRVVRVVAGFFFGAVLGIPLGYAMGMD